MLALESERLKHRVEFYQKVQTKNIEMCLKTEEYQGLLAKPRNYIRGHGTNSTSETLEGISSSLGAKNLTL